MIKKTFAAALAFALLLQTLIIPMFALRAFAEDGEEPGAIASEGVDGMLDDEAVNEAPENTSEINVTWYGCASFRLEFGETVIWLDPYISLIPEAADYPTSPETFAEARNIILSHGHFDHMMSVQELHRLQELSVYCTAAPRASLIRDGVTENRINLVAPGDSVGIGDVTLNVYQGRHIKYDAKYIAGVAWRTFTSIRRLANVIKMGLASRKFPEAKETIITEIIYEGKRVLFMGSAGLQEGAELPEPGAELLIFAYQGQSDPSGVTLDIVERLRPQAFMFAHHDNAIAPLTFRQDTARFAGLMAERFPDIRVIDPPANEIMFF